MGVVYHTGSERDGRSRYVLVCFVYPYVFGLVCPVFCVHLVFPVDKITCKKRQNLCGMLLLFLNITSQWNKFISSKQML